ncbi:Hypothetical Protein FCC1311_044922 [Hondaea fermentalgiana]|uniref:Uncharacterized protein n=1 Tax=Hondaea fermentalgiana TaxID=2315210 RepID=A0A2R5GD91_9STRA|nr:Hypothetical Protein FCC1311_044922 [Hondaea fermentalgiana]|eukprot:GBG28269.1 Hypothetical Protein FCC1311_044922 [Hondaea fermentalgiana]
MRAVHLLLASLAAALALTRPGQTERRATTKLAQTSVAEAAWSVGEERWHRWRSGEAPGWPHQLGPIPLDVSDTYTTDYLLFTMSVPKNPQSEKRRLGALGKIFPHTIEDDLFALGALLFVSYGLTYAAPSWVFRNMQPDLLRPWTIVLTSLYSESIFAALTGTMSLVTSGLLVQKTLGRQGYLLFFFLPGALAALAQLLTSRFPEPVGCEAAMFASITFAALAYPDQLFSVYGKELSGFMLMSTQIGLSLGPLLGVPPLLLKRLPTFSTGATVGLATYIVLNERQTRALLSWIPFDFEVPQLAASLIAANMLLTLAAYNFAR